MDQAAASFPGHGAPSRRQRSALAPGTAGWSMTRELLRFVLIGIVVLSLPVILVSLDTHLPTFALTADRFWRLVYAIACMILVITIPIIVAIVVVWVYARFLSEGVIVTLFSAGRSLAAILVPAVLTICAAVTLSFVVSTIVAPSNARYIHDTLLFLRRDMNLGLLESGAFHYFKNERTTIFFAKKIDKSQFADIYIIKHFDGVPEATNKEEVYFAKNAFMVQDKAEKALLLVDGGALISKDDDAEHKNIVFDRAFWRPDSGFSEPTRSYIFYDELDTGSFLRSRKEAQLDRKAQLLWLREAIKRFLLPLTTFLHAFLGLGILFLFSSATDRDNNAYVASAIATAAIFGIHLLYVYFIESMVMIGSFGFVLFLTGAVAELGLGLHLLSRAQKPQSRAALAALAALPLRFGFGDPFRATAAPAEEAPQAR